MFLFPYLGLAVPAIGIGIAALYTTETNVMTWCAGVPLAGIGAPAARHGKSAGAPDESRQDRVDPVTFQVTAVLDHLFHAYGRSTGDRWTRQAPSSPDCARSDRSPISGGRNTRSAGAPTAPNDSSSRQPETGKPSLASAPRTLRRARASALRDPAGAL